MLVLVNKPMQVLQNDANLLLRVLIRLLLNDMSSSNECLDVIPRSVYDNYYLC